MTTQGLAVLAATLAAAERTVWLAHTALVLCRLGLVPYGFALAHFDVRQVLEGTGDHWIPGGALAISALTGGRDCSSPRTMRACICGTTTIAVCCAP